MQQGVWTLHSEQHTRVSSCCLRLKDSDFEQSAAHSRDLLPHGSGGSAGCHRPTPSRNKGCEPLSMVAAALFKKCSYRSFPLATKEATARVNRGATPWRGYR